MKFGEIPLHAAEGAVLVHTTRAGELTLKKGRVLRPADLAALRQAGLATVIAATLEPDDIPEDAAAGRLALAVAGPGTRLEPAKTGRCNVHALHAGLLLVDTAEITRINQIDESITIATVAADLPVRSGDMVATIKIIPFSVPAPLLDAATCTVRDPDRIVDVRFSDHDAIDDLVSDGDTVSLVRDPDSMHNVRFPDVRSPDNNPDSPTSRANWPDQPATLRIHPWRGCRAGLVMTRFAETHPSLLEKSEAAQRERLRRCGGALTEVRTVAHRQEDVAAALAELAALGLDPILAMGASAIMDRRDVIPAAVEQLGGSLIRFGMPVDPGNLLLLATLPAQTPIPIPAPIPSPAPTPDPTTSTSRITVIGVPSCARSLKRSGFDWVLERACAGIPMTSADIARLGVGGLLEEIDLRPAPRNTSPAVPAAPQIAAIVLAAGRSARMGSAKLLEPLADRPMVRWAVEAALASAARPVVVVTGHRADEVAHALRDLPVTFVHNPDYAQGMATSLRAGISHVPHADAAVVCLGDMPRVTAHHIDRLIAAFDPTTAPIVVPTHDRKRGNPVLWARRFFPEIEDLRGDVGARALLDRHADQVHLLAIDDPAILLDVDTPQALALLRSEP